VTLPALILAAALAAPTPPAPLDAKTIYLKTVAAVNALPLPPYVAFTSQNDSEVGNTPIGDRLRVIMRTSDGDALVEPLRAMNGTPTPLAPTQLVTNGHFPSSIYRLGDFPLADFGLRLGPRTRPGIFEDSGTPEPDPASGLQQIAAVHVLDIPYTVVYLGENTVAGRAAYHLGLTPVRDPGHHVLREMWVDETSFLPVRYVAERFVDAELFKFRYFVGIDTALVDGHLVNIDAEGKFDVHRIAGIHYFGEGNWTISDVSFPSSEPDFLFPASPYSSPAAH